MIHSAIVLPFYFQKQQSGMLRLCYKQMQKWRFIFIVFRYSCQIIQKNLILKNSLLTGATIEMQSDKFVTHFCSRFYQSHHAYANKPPRFASRHDMNHFEDSSSRVWTSHCEANILDRRSCEKYVWTSRFESRLGTDFEKPRFYGCWWFNIFV